MFSGRSEENAWRRRSCGVGTRGAAGCSRGSARDSSGGAGGGGRSPSVSVLRKRAASGPSRMLARLPLPIREHLLRQLAIRVGRRAVGVVLEHRHALYGSFCEADRLADARTEDAVAEVLLEDLDRLLGMQGPRVDHRRE